MMDPRYRDVKASEIAEIPLEDGARVKVIAGEVNGVRGPVWDIFMALRERANLNHPEE
jgi:quercetin 2,3-dioxygenase